MTTLRDRALRVLPSWLAEKVPRDHWESDEAYRRRRRVVAATSLAGAGMLGAGLSTKPNSTAFYGITLATAATWTVGGLASGKLHLGWMPRGRILGGRISEDGGLRRPVVTPVALGVGAFGVFYAGALISRHIPVLNRAIASILQYADQGSPALVYTTTLANGAAEEVFFRGALFAAVGTRAPVATSTGVYMLATVATRNPALVLASGVMGALFGLQRRASGGIQAPMLTHLTWSTLMLRYLPPLFRTNAVPTNSASAPSSRSTSPSSV